MNNNVLICSSRQRAGLWLMLAALPIAPNGLADTGSIAEKHLFKVYDSLIYRHKPDLRSLGLLPTRDLARFWPKGASRDGVDEVYVRNEAKRLNGYRGLVYIDIENWPVYDVPDRIAQASIAKFVEVADIVHFNTANCQIAYYGVLPDRIYWPIIQKDEKALNKWHVANQQMDVIGAHVDIIAPSLYTFYDDPKGWRLYAEAMLIQARRYHKPVYAFLWPEFASNEPALQHKQLPANSWKGELDCCREFADGVVLWGGVVGGVG